MEVSKQASAEDGREHVVLLAGSPRKGWPYIKEPPESIELANSAWQSYLFRLMPAHLVAFSL